MLNTEIKNSLCGCALKLDNNDYIDKEAVYQILSIIKNSGEQLAKESLKYLLNSTQTNYRLGLVYQEWAESGYKVADLSSETKKRIVIILY